MFVVVFAWRSNGPDRKIWFSERYVETHFGVPAARTRFKRDISGKGRLVYTKLHTGTSYGNRGRFV